MPSPLPPNTELSSDVVHEPAGTRLILSGELDMNGVLDAERAVAEAAAAAGPGAPLTIDISGLDFIDLFGARTLLRVAGTVQRDGREVAIVNPQRHVRRLFALITDLPRGRGLVTDLVR